MFPKLDYTLELLEDFYKVLMPGITPRDLNLIGLGTA